MDPLNPSIQVFGDGSADNSPPPIPPVGGNVPAPSPAAGGPIYTHTTSEGQPYYAPDPAFPGQQPYNPTTDTINAPIPADLNRATEDLGTPGGPVPAVVEPSPTAAPAPEGTQPGVTQQPSTAEIDQILQRMDAEEPDSRVQSLSATRNFFNSFNSHIADVLGMPMEAVNNLFAATGIEALTGAKAGLPTAESFRKAMNAVGIGTEHLEDSISGQFGRESLNSMVMLSAMFAAAPYMAAQQGTNGVARIAQVIGESLQKHPWLSTFTDPAATFGGVLGERSTGSPLGALPGSILGGVLGNIAAGPVVGAVRSGKKIIDRMAENMANKMMPSTAARSSAGRVGTPVTPFRDEALSPEEATQRVQVYAENQIQGEIQRVEVGLADAINRITRPQIGTVNRGRNRGAAILATGPEAQERLAVQIEKVEEVARKIEDRFWRRVPQKTRVPVAELQKRTMELAQDIMDNGSMASLPREQMEELLNAVAPKRAPNGQMLPQELTVEKLRALRGSIRVARKTEQMGLRVGREPNSVKIGNMVELEKYIDDAISDGMPPGANVALDQARNYSVKMHDLFDRGPVGDLLARRNRGDWNWSPDKFMDELMKRYNGVASALNISRSLQNMKNPSPGKFHTQGLAYPGVATPPEVAELKALQDNMEDAIRALFRDQADSLGPDGAIKFIARHENSIRPMAKMHAEMIHTFANLTRLQEERRLITESALSRAMGQDGRIAVNRLFTDKNPADVARKLLNGETFEYSIGGNRNVYRIDGVKNDPLAYEGLRNAVIDEFFTRTKIDPLRSQQMLGRPEINRMMRTVLLPDDYNRLVKMIDTAVKIQKGDVQSLGQKVLPGAVILGRVMAANAAGVLAVFRGGGNSGASLQSAAIFSQAAKVSITKALSGLDAKTLLAKAVTDPNFERILYAKDPQTPAQVAHLQRIARRAVSVMEGLRATVVDQEPADAKLPRNANPTSAARPLDPTQQLLGGTTPNGGIGGGSSTGPGGGVVPPGVERRRMRGERGSVTPNFKKNVQEIESRPGFRRTFGEKITAPDKPVSGRGPTGIKGYEVIDTQTGNPVMGFGSIAAGGNQANGNTTLGTINREVQRLNRPGFEGRYQVRPIFEDVAP